MMAALLKCELGDLSEHTNSPEIGHNVTAAGIATNYLAQGEGPPVVLIHGSGPGVTGYANWRLVIPKLASHFRVYAPDVVGFGYTERPEHFAYDLDHWVDHLVGFLDALEIKKAHFVGNSFGGGLSVAMAARYPERVDRLVLMGSVGVSFPITAGLEDVWGYEPSMEAMSKLIDLFAYDRDLVTTDLIESRYRASIRPGYQESFARMFAVPRQERLDAIATPEKKIQAIQSRTLVVHGRDDRVIPLEVGLRLHHLIKESDMHIFGQCGHWTQVERADEFCALVTAFLLRR